MHPDRKATTGQLRFSPDSARLFVSGYPSGIVQVFEVATGKELVKIATPRGLRSSADYSTPDKDWKTLYVAIHSRTVERVVKDGKSVQVLKYTGEVRVFDLTTGNEKPALKRDGNGAVSRVRVSNDGKTLTSWETSAKLKDDGENALTSSIVEWDLATRTLRTLSEDNPKPRKSPDERWAATTQFDTKKLTTSLKVTDAKTGQETTLLAAGNNGFGFVNFSPDSRFLATNAHGNGRDINSEVHVWDLATSKEVDLPKLKGFVSDLAFSADGDWFLVWDFNGGTRLFDTKTWKERLLPVVDAKDHPGRWTISPDGKRLAVATNQISLDSRTPREPDPLDYPQARIYVYDLGSDAKPKVMVCPQGFATHLAFDPKGKWLAAGATGGVWLFDVSK